jgi:hypothetical protein
MTSDIKRDGSNLSIARPSSRRQPEPSSTAKRSSRAAVVQPLRDDHQELLSYVAQLSGELAMMSRAARLDALGYFLEMAKIEALGALSRLETAD